MSTPPLRPRLVFRAGFAGRKELTADEQRRLTTALHEVFTTLGDELAGLTLGVPVRAGGEPRVATFFARQCPLLRLVTGLCEGADAVAAQALETVQVLPDAGADCAADTPCLETELAAVLPFDVESYRHSRPADFLPEFDRQLARCAWVLALDGIFAKPEPDTALARTRRGRAYRAQSAFLLRHSDVLIAAANPGDTGKPGGTLETVREALAFELPVVFIHTGTGAVHLIAPEDDLHSALAESAPTTAQWKATLRQWVFHLTADPDSGLAPEEPDHSAARKHGETLLTEYFDQADSPAKDTAKPMMRFRKWAWDWFEKRFRSGEGPASDKPLAPYDAYRHRATELNYHYSGLYRGAFLLNYILAIAAVVLAAASLALLGTGGHTKLGAEIGALLQSAGHIPQETAVSTEPEPWLHPVLLVLAAMKLGIVIFISSNTRRANGKKWTFLSRATDRANGEKWNDRAVDYRYLAERLRGMYYLPQAGSHQPPAASPPQFASRVVRQSDVDWLFDAVVRSSSPAALNAAVPSTCGDVPVKKLLTLQPRTVVGEVRDAWIGEQAKYHDRNGRTMHSIHNVFEKVASFLAITVIVVVAIDLLLVGAEIFHLVPKEWEPTVKAATPYLISFSAVLPAIVAALGGIRFQSECQRLAERSAVMRVMLAGRKPRTHTPEVKGWRKCWLKFIAFWKTPWLVLQHIVAHPPKPQPFVFTAGRHSLADTLAKRIATAQAEPATDPGSWAHDVLRLTERTATDFVQEAAEWSVLYAREVSDPG